MVEKLIKVKQAAKILDCQENCLSFINSAIIKKATLLS